MANLENSIIKFYTNGAGKGECSKVSVAVMDDTELIAAFVSNEFGQFEQHSNNGPFDMAILNACEKANLRRGSVTIGFEPKEDELWRFNFFVFLSFSDGTRMAGGKVGIELNQDQKELRIMLDEIIR